MDLAQLLAGGPLAGHRALTMIHPLAMATRELHRRGRTAGLDEPGRVRVVDGQLVLHPPTGRYPDAGSLDDVRGLGALLYALVTGHWPLASGAPPGLPSAPHRPDGVVAAPSAIRPDVALEVSELAMAALGADQGRSAARICTAGAVTLLVEELLAEWTVDLLPPEDGNDPSWSYEPVLDRTATDAGTRRKLSLGMSGLVVAALLTFGLVGTQAASAFGVLPTNGPPPIVVGNNTPTGFEAGPVAEGTPNAPGTLGVLGGAGTLGTTGALDLLRGVLADTARPATRPAPTAARAVPERRTAPTRRPAAQERERRPQRDRDSDDSDDRDRDSDSDSDSDSNEDED